MIEVKNLSKSVDQLEILKEINFSINEGEFVSITGASGAGKTTLLQLLGTLDKPSSGEIIYDNQNIASLSKDDLSEFRNKHIGFVFQFHHLLPEFTALENVCIPAFIKKTNKKEAEQKAKELLTSFNLGNRLNHKPSELSGGEQQRVAIARALINSPKVILADEPSGNLDSENAEEIHSYFKMLKDKFNQTVIVVTHNPDLAEISDRKIIMKDGEIIA